jgi:carboxypeptidase Q
MKNRAVFGLITRPSRIVLLFVASLLVVAPLSAASPLGQDEKIDYATIGAIRQEAMNRSQAMDHVSWLADVYGPRLTGSPAMDQARDWIIAKFEEWGLENIHEERFAFGKGWSIERFSAHMLEPQVQPIIGYPKSWSSSTDGVITADVVHVQIESEEDFEQYRGQLEGKIVLTQPARVVEMLEADLVLRMDEEMMEEAEMMPIPTPRGAGGRSNDFRSAMALRQKIQEFYLEEDAAALLDRGSDSAWVSGGSNLSWQTQRTDGGTIFVGSGGSRGEDAGQGVPTATLSVEHYNRMIRILDKGVPVRMELNIQANFYDEADMNGFNLIAEIPGTDLAHEIVIMGAHLDSVHSATGATDNATGVAAMMEVMRVFKELGIQPRRTLRIALWGAEEQGLVGSRDYVKKHFADPSTMELKPDYENLSAYFNLDNGTGRVRGIWLEGNLGVKPVFEQWIEPLRDLGVTTIGPREVRGTDHGSFDAVGLPGFQFMQDRVEYRARTHHSNMDVVDRVQVEDMLVTATVAAVFAYNAAMRDERLPREAMPKPRTR